MLLMSKREWKEIHNKVNVGDILIVPKDPKNRKNKKPLHHYCGGVMDASTLPDPYEVIVLYKNNIGFITTLKDHPMFQPLSWWSGYNFKGTKIKMGQNNNWKKNEDS